MWCHRYLVLISTTAFNNNKMLLGRFGNVHQASLSFAQCVYRNSQNQSFRKLKRTNIFFRALITTDFSSSVLAENDLLHSKEIIHRGSRRSRKRSNEDGNGNSSISKEIKEYLSSKESLSRNSGKMPPIYLRKTKKSQEALYIVDDDVAKQFVSIIKSEWSLGDDHVVLEGNPGLGLVSKELCKAGVKNFLLYESNNLFHPMLEELQKENPDVIHISHKDIFSICKLAFLDKMDNGSRMKQILSQLPERKWTEDPAVKIVGTVPNLSFVKHLILNISFQTGLLMHGRPELYLAIPPIQYKHLSCGPDAGFLLYMSTSVLFQLFFEIEFLGKVPRKAFFPWDSESSNERNQLTKIKKIEAEHLYIVKIIPKKDLYDSVAPAEKLQQLWYFVRHHFMKRKNRIIPELERWIPGCGTRLVLQGMNIFTQFGELTPQEVLTLFHEFSNWPEYPHSPFLASVETAFLKMVHPDESVKDISESEELEHLQSSTGDEDEGTMTPFHP